MSQVLACLFLVAATLAAVETTEDAAGTLVLVQRRAAELRGTRDAVSRGCARLKNEGSYFTASLEVGPERQRFDVVADTGSDAVIIPSCTCRQSGECPPEDRCFRKPWHGFWPSMLFSEPNEENFIDLEFGSGSIKAEVSSAEVRVGSVEASMEEGLLLMVGRRLDLAGSFEGILGLGPLQSEYSPALAEIAGGERAMWDMPSEDMKEEAASGNNGDGIYIPGFLRAANISRYSICFNDGEQAGVLRLDAPTTVKGASSVGTLHWGLNFRGFSVGSTTAPALFCHGEEIAQETPTSTPGELRYDNMSNVVSPDDQLALLGSGAAARLPASEASSASLKCGIIPDSGTTIMLGPEQQVKALLKGLCEEWPRCANASAPEGEYADRPKEEVFQLLLARCETWLHEDNGSLDELPPIHIHIGDAKNNESLQLSPWSYVIETPTSEMESKSRLLGKLGMSLMSTDPAPTSEYSCAAAFGVSDYSSDVEEAVWILGAPVFYEYIVGFDRSKSPPEISFSTDECGSCDDNGEGSKSNVALAEKGHGRVRKPRALRRVPKAPRIGKHWQQNRQHRKAYHHSKKRSLASGERVKSTAPSGLS